MLIKIYRAKFHTIIRNILAVRCLLKEFYQTGGSVYFQVRKIFLASVLKFEINRIFY